MTAFRMGQGFPFSPGQRRGNRTLREGSTGIDPKIVCSGVTGSGFNAGGIETFL